MDESNTESTLNSPKHAISAATDGACSGNPGPGGWGCLIRFADGSIEEFGGYEPETTNNRMELQAVLEIFKHLKTLSYKDGLTIRTDSKYVINGLNSWIKSWKRNGWRTAAGKPVLNQDLWRSLDNERLANVELEHVKGHSGDPDNERVDKIAVSYSKNNGVKLQSTHIKTSTAPKKKSTLEKTNILSEPAPKELQKLISRLDMANHFAKHGYSLSIKELATLIEIAPIAIQEKKQPWQWRDWLIEPTQDSKWKLSFTQKQSSNSNNNKDV